MSVVLDAYSDAILDKTGKRNHFTESLTIAMFLLMVVSSVNIDVWRIVSSYILARIGVFNFVYNTARQLPFNYAGSTDQIFDKWIRKIPDIVVVSFQMIFVFMAVAVMFYNF